MRLAEGVRIGRAGEVGIMRNGVAVAEQIGNTLCAAIGNFYLAEHYLRSGRPDLALPSLERGIELGQYCNIGLGPSFRLARMGSSNRMPTDSTAQQ
ncbi:MAG: hypothetical protein ACRDFA_00270 [bacterium]